MNYMTNIKKLYVIKFFHNLIPAYVIERLFFEQRGLTIQMVIYTEIIYAVTVALLEIPTGIFADKFSRKSMMILNAILGCFEFIILIFAARFWHFAAVAVLAGLGKAACSGSENALLYDSLSTNGNVHLFEKALGRLAAFDFAASLLAALFGSLLAGHFAYELNYWISAFSMMISLLVSITLIEPQANLKQIESFAAKDYIIASLRFFKGNPQLLLVLLSGMSAGAAINFLDEFWQLYVRNIGVPVVYFGIISAVMCLLRLPGSLLAYEIKKHIGYKLLFSIILGLLAISFFYISITDTLSSLAAVALIFLLSGITEPIVTGYLHHRINSSARATIDSFQSLGLRVAVIFTGLGFGFFTSRLGLCGGYGFIALGCVVVFIGFIAAYNGVDE